MTIAQLNGQVKRIDERNYAVRSQSGHGEYQVILSELGWLCQCPDHLYRGQKCKHVFAVEFSRKLRETVANLIPTIIKPIDTRVCEKCSSSHIVRDSKRKTKHGEIQRWRCRECGGRMSFNLGFEGRRATPETITSCMQLYFSGESLRNIQKFLALQGIKKSHMSVYRWISHYVTLMDGYLDKLKPQVSDTWRTDELYLRIKGSQKYMYALMDDQTRYWISMQVAHTKGTEDVTPLFKDGKRIAGKKPLTLISDGAANFADAYVSEFWTNRKPQTTHIRHIHLRKDHNNNKMERLNGEVRDREKVMRGLKRMDTPILKGYQLYHNYFRPHEGLNGDTPASQAGIKIEGENKWITVIQNASKLQN
ncbi:DDE-type integrase/transposase/recombinase [Nitrososphaera sp.]|uniref:DDE-type integrase/transposase/recombinase n=1 Tax=Nitrososphaera sp. TaxID=1971748 RepID=UPI002EDAC2D0